MSSGNDNSSIVKDTLNSVISNYCANAGSGLVVWEYIITLGREMDLFWTSKVTGATILFFCNRYIGLISNINGLTGNAVISDQSCPDVAKLAQALDVLQYFPWAAFSGLRAFALSRNWPLAWSIVVLSLVPFGINISHFGFHLTGVNVPVTGCLLVDDTSSELNVKFTIASRTSLIAADILLIYVTWFHLYKLGAMNIRSSTQNRFVTVLLRDGTMYFIVLLIFNTLHMTLALLSVEYSVGNIGFITQFSQPLTTIIVSRFLFHLQAANRRVVVLDVGDGSSDTFAADTTQTDTLVFGRVVGSLGSSIEFGVDDYEYDYEDPPTVDRWNTRPDSENLGLGEDALTRKRSGAEAIAMSPLSH